MKNNIVIVPLRLYYGIDDKNLHKLSDKMVFSILNYMFDVEIQNNKDIAMLSNEYDNFDKIDELISGTKKDILFLGSELKKFSISERIEKSEARLLYCGFYILPTLIFYTPPNSQN